VTVTIFFAIYDNIFCYILSEESYMMRQKQSERGQGLVEYALILILVSLVVIIVLQIFGPVVGNVFSQIISLLAPLA